MHEKAAAASKLTTFVLMVCNEMSRWRCVWKLCKYSVLHEIGIVNVVEDPDDCISDSKDVLLK